MNELLETNSAAPLDQSLFLECMRAPGRPLVVRGGARHWPAMEKWTFEFFAEKFGDQVLGLTDCLLRPTLTVRARVRDYLAYVQHPEGTQLEAVARHHRLEVPLYAYGCRPFQAFPELLADFTLPSSVDDWCARLPDGFRHKVYPHGQPWLLLSGVGARSILHRDAGSTIAWFGQVRGRKSFVVHPLSDRPYVYDGQVDPRRPDAARFPLYARSRPLRFELGPGDLAWLPPDWYHFVVTESPSITVTGNVVNEVNFGDYLRYAYGDKLPEVLSSLPPPD